MFLNDLLVLMGSNVLKFKVMMFVNFTGETAESLKSKFREVATSSKGQDLAFLVGDAESSQGALQVTIFHFVSPNHFIQL